MSRSLLIVGWFLLGWLLFAGSSLGVRWLQDGALASLSQAHPTLPHFILKSSMIALALLMIFFFGSGGFAHHGFRWPSGRSTPFRWLALGAVPGALTTAAILLTPAKGLTHIAAFGLPAIVASIWIYSSVAEEIYVRGWLQTAFGDGRSAIWLSALFFCSLHLSLIWIGTDGWTVGIILCGTFALGLICAQLRSRHRSLWPAIVAHVGFNVGGFVLAIVANIVAVLATGHPIKS